MNAQVHTGWRAGLHRVRRSLANVADDIAQGFFSITHNGFAMLGLAVAVVVIALVARPDLRDSAESRLMALLMERQESVLGVVEPGAVDRVTAVNPKELPKEQAAVTHWISRKYAVAPEPVGALVAAAYDLGARVQLDPTLILAVMAIESGFNPFAQSPVGAQGLMQVMTGIHREKYQHYGGTLAAFDPLSNLRVGVKILKEYVARAGSIEGGLRYYVGAAHLDNDGGYTAKVLAEHGRLQLVAQGKRVPLFAPAPAAAPAVAPAAEQAASEPAGPAGPMASTGNS